METSASGRAPLKSPGLGSIWGTFVASFLCGKENGNGVIKAVSSSHLYPQSMTLHIDRTQTGLQRKDSDSTLLKPWVKDHLHRIGILDNPSCSYGADAESVDHVLLDNIHYVSARDYLVAKIESGYVKTNTPPHLRTLAFIESLVTTVNCQVLWGSKSVKHSRVSSGISQSTSNALSTL